MLVETLSLFGLYSVVLFGRGVFAAGGFGVGSGVASGLGAMFLADLQRGVTGGDFVTKLSALIRAELGSFFGRSLVHFWLRGSCHLHCLGSLLAHMIHLSLHCKVVCYYGLFLVSCLILFGNGFPHLQQVQ